VPVTHSERKPVSVRALNWAKLQKTGQPAAKLVLMLLADRCRPMRLPNAPESPKQERCFPGADTLAAEAEVSDRYVRDMLRILVSLGLVEVTARYKDCRRTTNLYTLAVPDDFEPPPQESPAQSNRNHGSSSEGPTGTMVPVEGRPTGTIVPRLPEPWFLAEPEVEPEVPPPPTPSSAAATSHTGPKAEAEEAAPGEPHPDAAAIIDALDLDRAPGKSERAQLLALITAALLAGWAIPDVVANLNRDWTRANDRVRTAIGRARDLDLDNPPRPAISAARASPKPRHCGTCHESTRMVQPDSGAPYRCPRCHPNTPQKAA
jgi:hypothetical protein